MNISTIQLVSVPVTDQDRALAFYTEVLGLRLVRDNPMGENARWVEVAPASGGTGLTLVTWFPQMPPGGVAGLVLQTDDIDGDIARLKEHGVTVDGPQDAPWGRFGTLTDPDGNGIVLSGPPTPGT
ncbi:catechol 2,3-dioxygenase-like lactoylglutathione lyase family enzyme [Stackebrandtia albiflava]|uniref:Catechol 2,3-dioxygenase-like lactoylglutathione lyase family enzyme n=1 Tax=Stackebrandtia albiflava TaxID=406432 RepID=A0A562URQ1_9ACTN|nr:VOC family protein [Stackebrandtia albiflava]TWJ08292.1 catechol 2,3-dioxygenase-like lactoylglutathione lyase family enzyme [Stackebrandtia albiflava]